MSMTTSFVTGHMRSEVAMVTMPWLIYHSLLMAGSSLKCRITYWDVYVSVLSVAVKMG